MEIAHEKCFHCFRRIDEDHAVIEPDPRFFRRRAVIVTLFSPVVLVVTLVLSAPFVLSIALPLLPIIGALGYLFGAKAGHRLWRVVKLNRSNGTLTICDPATESRVITELVALQLCEGRRYASKTWPIGTFQAFQLLIVHAGGRECLLQTGSEERLKAVAEHAADFLRVPLHA